jgi:hypothetical protein
MMSTQQFELDIPRIEGDLLRVRQGRGDGTVFAFCPPFFETTSSIFAELLDRSDCDTTRGTPPVSEGLTVQEDTLSGDYGSEMAQGVSHIEFICTRN